MLLRTVLVGFCFFIAACEASHTVIGSTAGPDYSNYLLNPSPTASLKTTADSIMTSKCLNCHGPGSPRGELDLNDLINDGFISQGPVNVSILYRCINGASGATCVTRSGGSASDMAALGGLTAQEISDINAYIDDLYLDPSMP